MDSPPVLTIGNVLDGILIGGLAVDSFPISREFLPCLIEMSRQGALYPYAVGTVVDDPGQPWAMAHIREWSPQDMRP